MVVSNMDLLILGPCVNPLFLPIVAGYKLAKLLLYPLAFPTFLYVKNHSTLSFFSVEDKALQILNNV